MPLIAPVEQGRGESIKDIWLLPSLPNFRQVLSGGRLPAEGGRAVTVSGAVSGR